MSEEANNVLRWETRVSTDKKTLKTTVEVRGKGDDVSATTLEPSQIWLVVYSLMREVQNLEPAEAIILDGVQYQRENPEIVASVKAAITGLCDTLKVLDEHKKLIVP